MAVTLNTYPKSYLPPTLDILPPVEDKTSTVKTLICDSFSQEINIKVENVIMSESLKKKVIQYM